jgi:hypothetical protein
MKECTFYSLLSSNILRFCTIMSVTHHEFNHIINSTPSETHIKQHAVLTFILADVVPRFLRVRRRLYEHESVSFLFVMLCCFLSAFGVLSTEVSVALFFHATINAFVAGYLLIAGIAEKRERTREYSEFVPHPTKTLQEKARAKVTHHLVQLSISPCSLYTYLGSFPAGTCNMMSVQFVGRKTSAKGVKTPVRDIPHTTGKRNIGRKDTKKCLNV